MRPSPNAIHVQALLERACLRNGHPASGATVNRPRLAVPACPGGRCSLFTIFYLPFALDDAFETAPIYCIIEGQTIDIALTLTKHIYRGVRYETLDSPVSCRSLDAGLA